MTEEENSKEKDEYMDFFCEKCNLYFKIKDGTPLDDVKCPKCGTVEIFIVYEEDENGKVNL